MIQRSWSHGEMPKAMVSKKTKGLMHLYVRVLPCKAMFVFGGVPRIRGIAGPSTPYDLPQKGILAKWPGRSSSWYGSRSIDGSSDASDEHMSYCLNS